MVLNVRGNVVVFFLGLLTAAGAQSADPLSGAAFSASVDQLREASAGMPVNRLYHAQILLEEGDYKIAADGTLFYRHRLIYRVDTAQGVEGWSEISSTWDPWFEKPAQLHARVLAADGKFVELDQKTVTDAPVKADDSETFSSEHVRRAPLPGVAVGSIVEEEEITEEKTAYFKDGSLYGFRFKENVPVGRARLIVDTPASMPFKDDLSDAAGVTVTRSATGTGAEGRRRVMYEASHVEARYNSDIDLASDVAVGPRVDFATGVSWEAVAAGYARLAEPQTVPEDAKPLLPVNLAAERMARIRAIVQKLHKEVRYTGVEFGSAKLTPMRPSEVIGRHYGDCKDKATLLVAMLRAAGIPADLALLNTGPGRDVSDGLAGMNRFDHAIVYVPAAKDGGAIWIDATAQFHEVGTLPYADQGRMALVIAAETKGLTRTPVAVAEDSVLEESRVFTLPGLGEAHVVERSKTHGYVDANYRASYGSVETPKIHEEMEGYVKRAYLAKKLTAIEHGDGSDLEHPFVLKLVVDGAKRGATSLIDGIVVVFPNGGTNSLPKWFSQAPPVVGADTSAEAREEMDRQVKSRLARYSFRPFIQDQKTTMVVPAGFVLRSLPAGKTTQVGTATLVESYGQSGNEVTAEFRFDSGPGTLTLDQALAMRTAVLELNKREYVGLYLDQIGAKELAAGHIRKALETDRAIIAAHPNDALEHMRLARALLEAGIGDGAQAEAKKATELDPKLAAAWVTLGSTLEHDSLGVRFGKGFDRAGALAAYRKAVPLDDDNNDAAYSMAILLEFNALGTRYAADADMAEAIKTYRGLVEKTKDKDVNAANQFRENMMFAMLFSKQFGELDKMLAGLPASNTHTAMAITSATAQHGAAAGIAQAEKGNVATTERNKNLRTAGEQLSRLRLYAEAADVMSAGMQGGDDAPTVARKIELYRGLKGASMAPLAATNPARPIQVITVGTMAGTLTREEAEAALSRQAYASKEELERDVKKNLANTGFLKAVAEKSDMSETVLLDLIAGAMTFTSTGDDANGYAVVMQSLGGDPAKFYVVKDDGSYRVIADEHDDAQVGNAVIWALAHGKNGEAKALLDWKRDFTHKGGTDDPFEGPLLPRFWTVGSSKSGADSPEAMKLAGISLVAGASSVKAHLGEIAAAKEKAQGQRQIDLELLLAVAAVSAEDAKIAGASAKRLLEIEPDSQIAIGLAGQAYAYEGDAKGWHEMLAPRLAKKPKDHDLLEQEARAYALGKDWDAAQATEQKVLDSGKATSSDYNSFAWLGLFRGAKGIGDETTKAAVQSNMMSKNASFADLHTLACVYAAAGKTTEARQVLAQAMYAGNASEPNSAVWYALGLIYEQYGERDAALKAYRKVEAHEGDDRRYVDPVATYVLAQGRISELGGS